MDTTSAQMRLLQDLTNPRRLAGWTTYAAWGCKKPPRLGLRGALAAASKNKCRSGACTSSRDVFGGRLFLQAPSDAAHTSQPTKGARRCPADLEAGQRARAPSKDVVWGPLVFEARRFVELRKKSFWDQFMSAESFGMGVFYTANVRGGALLLLSSDSACPGHV